MAIVKGIKPSIAAKIVENAFRDVVGFGEEALAALSLNQKFSDFFGDDNEQVRLILDYVRTNDTGGLLGMSPPRTIQIEDISGINTKSTIRLLVVRLSDFAFFEED